MSMLPRLRPDKFYDLVIEVAIVRPGPIQGDMVHPYLRRRQGIEKPDYPSPELKDVLEKTLGIPLFQEQATKIVLIVAAGFTPSEADQLRRAMATFKRAGTIGHFKRKMIEGMVARKYPQDYAERCFAQIEGFGTYGFPESHAASFAILVYVSAWIKCRYPDVFACALLNSQPMGFYAPAQIVRDAREHGVEIRDVDVNASEWDCTLELGIPSSPAGEGAARSAADEGGNHADRGDRHMGSGEHDFQITPHPAGFAGHLLPLGEKEPLKLHRRHESMRDEIRSIHAVRLGFREVNGLRGRGAWNILVAMRGRGYDPVRDLWLRTGLSTSVLERVWPRPMPSGPSGSTGAMLSGGARPQSRWGQG